MMGARANRQRGEIEAVIDGRSRILCLTLGALAELETAFGVDNIADLAARFAGGKISAKGLIAIIAAGLRGGGNVIDDDEVAELLIEGGIEGAVRLAGRLLAGAFPNEKSAIATESGALPPNPQQPQPAA